MSSFVVPSISITAPILSSSSEATTKAAQKDASHYQGQVIHREDAHEISVQSSTSHLEQNQQLMSFDEETELDFDHQRNPYGSGEPNSDQDDQQDLMLDEESFMERKRSVIETIRANIAAFHEQLEDLNQREAELLQGSTSYLDNLKNTHRVMFSRYRNVLE